MVLRKSPLLSTTSFNKRAKALLRKHEGVRTVKALVKKLKGRGEYLGDNEEKNAFAISAHHYNQDVVEPRNRKVKKMQTLISRTKAFYKSKREEMTVDLTEFVAEFSEEYVKAITTIKGARRPLIEFGGKIFTMSDRTIGSIVRILEGVMDGEETTSDAEITHQITEDGEFKLTKSDPLKGVNGEYCPDYTVIKKEDVDFSALQIFDKKENADYSKSCFDNALEMSGRLTPLELQAMRLALQTREMPQRKIEEIAQLINKHIAVHRPESNKHVRHYGDKSLPAIDIGLIKDHYFPFVEIKATAFSLEHYDEIKHLAEWWLIKQKTPSGGYKKCKTNPRFIKSYDAVQLIYKHGLMKPIPVNDVLSTPYFNRVKDIDMLEYTSEQVFQKKYVPKERKGGENTYIDVETTTTGEKHVPYLCRMVYGKQSVVFYGEDCCLQMLRYICAIHYPKQKDNGLFEKVDVIPLYAHNMKYDLYAGLIQCLGNISMIGPKGTILSASGDFKYLGVLFRFRIQDTYALIPERLATFGDMFKLDIEKEVMPYDLYTPETVERRHIPVDQCFAHCDLQCQKNNIGRTVTRNEKKEFRNIFLTNAKRWGCVKNKRVDIIEYSSRYCEMDCRVLQKGYETFRRWLLEITGLDVDCFVSISSMVQAFYESKGVYDDVYMLAGNVREFVQKCMVGGRTMLAQNKKARFGYASNEMDSRLADLDAVSLYASAMSRRGGYLRGKPQILEVLSYDFLKKQDGYFVEIQIESIGVARKFSLMSVMNKSGVREFTNIMAGQRIHVDKVSLEDLIEFQNVDFKIIRGYYFNEGRNEMLKECIDHLFAERVKYKKLKNPIERVYKLMMNSSYGKCLLKPIADELVYVKSTDLNVYIQRNYNRIDTITKISEYASMVKIVKPTMNHANLAHCGVEVLSMSKRLMNEVMCLAEDLGKHIYYQDTDSMHIADEDIDPLADAFREKYGRELLGKGMGHFHSDFNSKILRSDVQPITAKRSIFLGKKCYIDELVGTDANGEEAVDYHVRLKGVPTASIHHLAHTNNCSVMSIFEDLYDGKAKVFDLLCGGLKCSFKFNSNLSITSRENFSRRIQF